MEHERNDLWARAVFHERLVKAGIGRDVGTIAVMLRYVPFWVLCRQDGTVTAHPAAETADVGLSSIKVPPGRLVFFEEDSRPGVAAVTPTVSLGAVLGDEKEETLGRIDLIYLPVYSMRAVSADGEHSSLLVADSSRLYSATTSIQGQTSYARPLLFFIGVACYFAAVGFLVDDVYAKAAAIGAGGLILFLVSPLAIGRAQ
jgi:hypothetical protein